MLYEQITKEKAENSLKKIYRIHTNNEEATKKREEKKKHRDRKNCDNDRESQTNTIIILANKHLIMATNNIETDSFDIDA